LTLQAVRDDHHWPDYQVVCCGAVVGVAAVAAVASCEHAYALVRAHGETGWIGRLVPLTVDGLICASSMVLLDSARREVPVPALARWLLGLGIAATLAADVAHGLGHGPVGAAVAAWPAVALVGSYELFMTIIRGAWQPDGGGSGAGHAPGAVSGTDLLQVQAAEVFAADVAAGRVPSIRAIRSRLRVGQPRGRYARIWTHSLTGRSAESTQWRSCRAARRRTARRCRSGPRRPDLCRLPPHHLRRHVHHVLQARRQP
jgi:hypothetical protein